MDNLWISPSPIGVNALASLPYSISSLYFLIAVALGVSVIISKNPIVSVLYLIGLFMVMASYLMNMGVEFIGLSYILVYVGAVSILFLFILMLINVRVSELITDNNNGVPLSLIAISIFSIVYSQSTLAGNNILIDLRNVLYSSINNYKLDASLYNEYSGEVSKLFVENVSTYFASSNSWDTFLSHISHITSIGNVIYTLHPTLLFITSIILLLSMIGSIIITLKQ